MYLGKEGIERAEDLHDAIVEAEVFAALKHERVRFSIASQ